MSPIGPSSRKSPRLAPPSDDFDDLSAMPAIPPPEGRLRHGFSFFFISGCRVFEDDDEEEEDADAEEEEKE